MFALGTSLTALNPVGVCARQRTGRPRSPAGPQRAVCEVSIHTPAAGTVPPPPSRGPAAGGFQPAPSLPPCGPVLPFLPGHSHLGTMNAKKSPSLEAKSVWQLCFKSASVRPRGGDGRPGPGRGLGGRGRWQDRRASSRPAAPSRLSRGIPAHTRADFSRVGIWGDVPGKQSGSSSSLPVLTGPAPERGAVARVRRPAEVTPEAPQLPEHSGPGLQESSPTFRGRLGRSWLSPYQSREGAPLCADPADVGVRSRHPQTQPRGGAAAGEAESRTRGQFESNPGASLPLSQHGGRRWASPVSGCPLRSPCIRSPVTAAPLPLPTQKQDHFPLAAETLLRAVGVLPGVKPARCPILCRGSPWVSASTNGSHPTYRSCHCHQERGYLKEPCPVSLAPSPHLEGTLPAQLAPVAEPQQRVRSSVP